MSGERKRGLGQAQANGVKRANTLIEPSPNRYPIRMKSFRFTYGPRLISGPGCTAEIGALLPPGPCLFVTDSQILSLGLAEPALESLRAAGADPILFDSVEADPSLETLMAAVEAGRGCAS